MPKSFPCELFFSLGVHVQNQSTICRKKQGKNCDFNISIIST